MGLAGNRLRSRECHAERLRVGRSTPTGWVTWGRQDSLRLQTGGLQAACVARRGPACVCVSLQVWCSFQPRSCPRHPRTCRMWWCELLNSLGLQPSPSTGGFPAGQLQARGRFGSCEPLGARPLLFPSSGERISESQTRSYGSHVPETSSIFILSSVFKMGVGFQNVCR